MRLCSFFGVLAVLLACIGLYGVLSYSIAQRNREIGIRIALGATRRGVIWMALRETLPMVLTGLAGGSFLALVTTRFLSTLIFGLTATDPETIALAIMLLIFAAGVATHLPARRAGPGGATAVTR